jgi:hypothetical protein
LKAPLVRACHKRAIEAAIPAASQRKETIMSNKPTLYAYAVKDRGEGQKAIWTRIGAVWPHDKGNGLTIELDALPITGRLVLTEPKADIAQDGGDQ